MNHHVTVSTPEHSIAVGQILKIVGGPKKLRVYKKNSANSISVEITAIQCKVSSLSRDAITFEVKQLNEKGFEQKHPKFTGQIPPNAVLRGVAG